MLYPEKVVTSKKGDNVSDRTNLSPLQYTLPLIDTGLTNTRISEGKVERRKMEKIDPNSLPTSVVCAEEEF